MKEDDKFMPRKSNKTAHVLGLITNKNDSTNDPETEEETQIEGSSETSSKKNSNTPIFQYENDPDNSLSNLIDNELSKLVGEKTDEHNTAITEEIANDETTNEPIEELNTLEIAEQNSSVDVKEYTFPSLDEIEKTNENESTETQSVENLSTDKDYYSQTESINLEELSVVSDVIPKNEETNISEIEILKNEPEEVLPEKFEILKHDKQLNITPVTGTDGTHYFCKNIMESVVLDKMSEIIPTMDMCGCKKCQLDILAIILNKLTPKYIVSEHGSLLARVNMYATQFSTNIIAETIKACMVVKKSPRH